MRRVTPEEFIKLVEERMAKGMTYEAATSSLCLDGERPAFHFNEVSESFLQSAGPADSYDGEADNSLSILEQAEQTARDQGVYESIGWTPRLPDPDEALAEVIEAAMRRGRTDHLYKAIGKLTAQEQAVVRGIYWGEARQQDIARGLRVSQQAVSDAHRRALRKLRAAFGLHEDGHTRPPRPTWDEARANILEEQRQRMKAVELRTKRVRERAQVSP